MNAGDGSHPVLLDEAFATHNGPLFTHWHDGPLRVGFRVGPNHVNPGDNCHGGMLATPPRSASSLRPVAKVTLHQGSPGLAAPGHPV